MPACASPWFARPGQHSSQRSAGADAARGRRPHLVLLDVVMPVADGGEVLRRLRHDRDAAAFAVVVLSTGCSVK